MEKMPFTNYHELNANANAKLKEAMMNERSKRWTKVVQNYRSLLRMISLSNFPEGYEPPDGYGMLLYELNYGLGWALQQIGEHDKAVRAYTRAINAVTIPKNGCYAKCNANSCLMTPVYAKRAFANARVGDFKSALKDAERTVVLDSRNPDVYVIRALVRNTRGEESEALKDVNKSLTINSNHIASLMLRGALQKPLVGLTDFFSSGQGPPNKDQIKACNINPDCNNFLEVTTMNHSDTAKFYDRFLYSLNVPHTIPVINMIPTTEKTRKPTDEAVTSYQSPMKFVQPADQGKLGKQFRCGSTTTYGRTSAQRRREYGDTLREHVMRPKTADQVIEKIYRDLQKKHYEKLAASRPKTAAGRLYDQNSQQTMSKKSLSWGESLNSSDSSTSKKIPAFQPVNVRDAPRMYYKPWQGDKLPVAEVRKRIPQPAFY